MRSSGVQPKVTTEDVIGEVDLEEGGGVSEAVGNGASKSVAGEVDDAEGGNVAQVHPQDGATEVAREEPDGAVGTVGCGIGELEPQDRAEGEGYELSIQCGRRGKRANGQTLLWVDPGLDYHQEIEGLAFVAEPLYKDGDAEGVLDMVPPAHPLGFLQQACKHVMSYKTGRSE
ncbi:hypothetical protein BHE74_00050296 [Ensete ventricosum]|nr:hypothetical protein BHE74_00050296 [Ensete ventricosum]